MELTKPSNDIPTEFVLKYIVRERDKYKAKLEELIPYTKSLELKVKSLEAELGNGPWNKGYQPSGIQLANGVDTETIKTMLLTCEDMKLVIAAEGSIYDEHHGNSSEVIEAYPTEEEFYNEVLRRFNKMKK